VAEEKAAAPAAVAHGEKEAKGGKPILLYALVVLNMAVVGGVGFMVFAGRKHDQANATALDKAANGLAKDGANEAKHTAKPEGKEGEKAAGKEGEKGAAHEEEGQEFIGKTIPMETFLVNLSGNRGNKLLKVNMDLELEGGKIAEEIDKRKPQIRDIIIILLSSKTYAQLSSPEGKEFLRDEIRDTVNSFLTTGKIKRVLFTEFLFN
jgi:flagellar FliL protein